MVYHCIIQEKELCHYELFKLVTRRVKKIGLHAIAGDLNVYGQKIKDFENEEVALPLLSDCIPFPDNEGFFSWLQIISTSLLTSAGTNLVFFEKC